MSQTGPAPWHLDTEVMLYKLHYTQYKTIESVTNWTCTLAPVHRSNGVQVTLYTIQDNRECHKLHLHLGTCTHRMYSVMVYKLHYTQYKTIESVTNWTCTLAPVHRSNGVQVTLYTIQDNRECHKLHLHLGTCTQK